jgi:cysteine-S-conjugate beta-lyase
MNFDRIIDRRLTESAKWNWYGEDVLPMWVADMDFRSPEPVIKALQKRVEHGVFGYGCPPDGLDSAIVDHLADLHGWQVDKQNISLVSGVVKGFTHAIYSLTDPGDGILIQTPVYPPILKAPAATGRRCVMSELIRQQDGRYEIDFDDFEDKAANEVKLFILCSPHNPVGKVFSKEELTRLAEICLRHDVLICTDEIHAELVFSESKHIPIASLSDEVSDITVTYMAPSKTFNLAGLAASFYIANNDVIKKQLSQTMTMLLGHPSILGLHAARAAYQHGHPWLKDLLIYLQSNRDYLLDFIGREMPAIEMGTPQGTYLGWLDCRGLKLDQSPQAFFLEKAKVGLNEGRDFGLPGEGFVRINFGCPRVLLEEGLARMKDAI